MDPKITVALIALLGVVIGGFLQGGVNWVLARREEKRALKVSARLVLSDLDEAHGWIEFALDENSWGALIGRQLRPSTWADNRDKFAAALPDEQWDVLWESIKMTADVEQAAAQQKGDDPVFPATAPGAPPDVDRVTLTDATVGLSKAIKALSSAADWSRPKQMAELGDELREEPGVLEKDDEPV